MREQAKRTPKEIQSVARAIQLIDCFDSRRPILSLAEICDIVELNKSTVYGILYTLSKYGYIDKDPKSGKYMLGRELANKGMLVNGSQYGNLEAASVKYLKQLTLRYKVTSYLFSYAGGQLTCLEMLIPNDSSYGAVSSVLGRKMAYHAAASGKVVMAHFTEQQMEKHLQKKPLYRFTASTLTEPEAIRNDARDTLRGGYAHERNEVDDDLSALSVPIYDNSGTLIGTLSISGQTEWIDKTLEEMVADMKSFSQAITEKLF